MQPVHPAGLNRVPAFRRARVLIAELCDGPPETVDQHLRHLALQVPTRLVSQAAHPDDCNGMENELRGAAVRLYQEIERAGERGELAPARYQRLRHLGEELLDVC